VLTSAEALLLDTFDLQDRDRIVTFLTRERGKVRGVAKGARRKYSRFAGQLQPLAKVKVTWFEREGRDLVRISDVESVRPASRLLGELEDILLASYLAEHLLAFAQENEPAELYYRLLDSTVEALLAGVDRDLVARFFEIWMLRLAGIFPSPVECPACGREMDAARGAVLPASGEGLVCVDCGAGAHGTADHGLPPGALAVPPEVMALLERFGHVRLGELARQPPPPELLTRIEEIASRVRRSFLQHELKSYGVMRRTLGTDTGRDERPGRAP
jgi:DNA repair protein RecO (recombination protein O)